MSIISEGLSAGGAEIKVPKLEKQKAATIVPKIKGKLIISTPNNKIPASIIKAVSYTHLDVYKRQTLGCNNSSIKATVKG